MEGIEHVVVLMLENRSFDHMLGLLDHPAPEFPRISVDTDDYSNPADPTDAHSARVRASADADFELPVEPPHSHASVMEQLGVRFGHPHMDGFVAAYRRRVQDPTRDRPVIHWIRIALVAGVALILVAAAIAWGAVWSLVVTWLALWAVVGIVALIVRRKRQVLPKLDWGSLAALPRSP